MEDPNIPGLLVCHEDVDEFDPWRLPARETEDISLETPRPDVSLSPGPMNIAINQEALVVGADPSGDSVETADTLQDIGLAPPVPVVYPSTPWSANTTYSVGQQVTPGIAVGYNVVGQTIIVYTCLMGGTSGSSAPSWTSDLGTLTVDNGILWANAGLYLP